MNEIINKKGSEAIIELDFLKKIVTKTRLIKKYRETELDIKIRKERTKKEGNIIKRAKLLNLPVPTIISIKKYILEMDFIEGERVKITKKNAFETGKLLKKFHDNKIIHNDFTPANLIKNGKKIYVIDFGLAFTSHRTEDKASDLFTCATSFKPFENEVVKGYDNKEVIERYFKIRKRMRYIK